MACCMTKGTLIRPLHASSDAKCSNVECDYKPISQPPSSKKMNPTSRPSPRKHLLRQPCSTLVVNSHYFMYPQLTPKIEVVSESSKKSAAAGAKAASARPIRPILIHVTESVAN